MPLTAPEISEVRKAGSYFLPRTPNDGSKRDEIDYSKFLKDGVLEYKPLEGVSMPGIHFVRHKKESESTLLWQRRGRIVATASSVALSILASIGLVYSGTKLIVNSVFGRGSVDEAFQNIGSAYTKSSIAGVLTGVAHESPNWALGNLGMGIFSRYLNNIGGLAGFMISDGLSSIGMGEVRYREKGNAFTIQHSIFNNPHISFLSFLKPIEQSIYSFGKRLSTPSGWKLLREAEPYALFNTAGGGLVAAGGAMGIMSLFKNFMSESVQSFAYLPAALFSLVSLGAFFRDGVVQVDRSHYIGGGKKKEENYTQRAEGYFKQAASPFLALRNMLFAAKGFGFDSSGSLHNVAIGMQAYGAAFAFLGFTAQSFLKFFKPELFGAKLKQYIEVILNPKEAAKELKKLMRYLNTDEVKEKFEKKESFTSELTDIVLGDEHSKILTRIMDTNIFKALFHKSQAGFPIIGSEKTYPRFYLDRGNHSIRTCAIGIILLNALENNTADYEAVNLLKENKLAFKIACLLHDLQHGPFSHVLDKALPGYDNDHETIKMIRDPNSEIHKTILKACNEEGIDGNKTIEQVLFILGRYSELYHLLSGWGADRIDYIRFSDFPVVNNGRMLFPEWTVDDLKYYANTFRLYSDSNGNKKLAHTPEGALLAFLMCSDRQLFNRMVNGRPSAFATDLIASIALSECSPQEIINKSEEEVARIIFNKIDNLSPGESTVLSKIFEGGRNSYTYYSPLPEDPSNIRVLDDGRVYEFLEYLNIRGIDNYVTDLKENSKWFKTDPRSCTQLIDELKSRIIAATTLHEIYTKVIVRIPLVSEQLASDKVENLQPAI